MEIVACKSVFAKWSKAFAVALAIAVSGPAERARSEDMKISSDAFPEGGTIPKEHSCDGADRSPRLAWEGAPSGTRAFALICEDPDAPMGLFTHWVIYDIPAAATGLAAGVAKDKSLPDGSRQGKNDFGRIGYGGPCPPRGSNHRYTFKLFALSAPVDLEPGASRGALLKAVKGKTLAEAQVMGRFGR